jgi:four helix bundle protein
MVNQGKFMPLAKHFRDLDVYQQAGRAAKLIFSITKRFPSEERFSLTDQIRRSSRAVNSMIAEAWARRPYPAAFVSKLNEALGEAMETQAWLDHSFACRYLTKEEYEKLDRDWQQIGGMIVRMSDNAASFCQRSVSRRTTSR